MADQGTTKKPSFLFCLSDKWELLRTFFEAGVVPALYDALMLASDSGQPPPDWAVEGALRIVGDRLKFGFTKGKGATGNELSKYQAAMRRYRRWQAVKKLRENGIVWSDVYVEAEKLLKGTFAEAKDETIKKSYQRVENDLKDPEKYPEYYLAYREVQELTDTPILDLG